MSTVRLTLILVCCLGTAAAATEATAFMGFIWEPGLLPGWDLHGELSLGPAQLGLAALGEAESPVWAGGTAMFSGSGLAGGWRTWWDPGDSQLRYVQVEFGVAAGGHTARSVLVWADADGSGVLSWGSWLRIGWPEEYPAGWSASIDLGASRTNLSLSRPGYWRTAEGEFTPGMGAWGLDFREAELALWLHMWRLETVLTWPWGFQSALLSGEVPLGWLVIKLEQEFAPHGNTLRVWPELRIAAGCLVLYFDVLWSPPLVLHSVLLEGIVLEGGPPGAHIELVIDLGEYDLLDDPHRVRLSVQLLRDFGTAYSILFLQQGPPILTWSRLDLGFRVHVSASVELSTHMSLDTVGLAQLKGSVRLSLPSGL